MWTFAVCVSGAWAGIKGVGYVSFFFFFWLEKRARSTIGGSRVAAPSEQVPHDTRSVCCF